MSQVIFLLNLLQECANVAVFGLAIAAGQYVLMIGAFTLEDKDRLWRSKNRRFTIGSAFILSGFPVLFGILFIGEWLTGVGEREWQRPFTFAFFAGAAVSLIALALTYRSFVTKIERELDKLGGILNSLRNLGEALRAEFMARGPDRKTKHSQSKTSANQVWSTITEYRRTERLPVLPLKLSAAAAFALLTVFGSIQYLLCPATSSESIERLESFAFGAAAGIVLCTILTLLVPRTATALCGSERKKVFRPACC